MSRGYDVAPDGRFLINVPAEKTEALRQQLVLVQHWHEELKARVPLTKPD